MMRARSVLCGAALVLCTAAVALADPVHFEQLDFEALDGWADDDHAAAFATFRSTCPDLDAEHWGAVCAFATSDPEPRAFFELLFRPVRVGASGDALYTGYYEPQFRAARRKYGPYQYPLHRTPPDLVRGEPWLTRAEIAESDALDGHQIAWLRDPVDLYFLQMQGSGRLKMPDGSVLRVGYAARNGHPFRPATAEIVRRGIYESHQASEAVIRNWVRRNPEKGRDLLLQDPSYVFFRTIDNEPVENGPRGAMNRPLTAERSLAVDPSIVPLGAPVWIETDGATPLHRLMVAQDTGGAIKGPGRGDIFFGSGRQAGTRASRVRDSGDMVILLPIERAFAVLDGG